MPAMVALPKIDGWANAGGANAGGESVVRRIEEKGGVNAGRRFGQVSAPGAGWRGVGSSFASTGSR